MVHVAVPRDTVVLVLEDDPNRIHKFRRDLIGVTSVEYAQTAAHAKQLLTTRDYDLIFLDHDLGGDTYVDSTEENTGAEVARFLARLEQWQDPKTTVVVCHSLNPDGRKYMITTLRNAGFSQVHDIPFTELELE